MNWLESDICRQDDNLKDTTRKVLLLSLFSLIYSLFPAFAAAQSCLNPGHGTGNDVPCITSITTPYNGDPTKAQVCASTQHPADFLIETYYTVNSYNSPDADYYAYYDPTMAASHCGIISRLMPGGKTYAFNVGTCSTGSGGGGPAPFNCKRTDPNYSVAPIGNGQSNGMTFTTATPTGSSFTWTSFVTGSAPYIYAGHSTNIAVSNQWLTGGTSVAPSYLFVTSITVDGQICAQSGTGGECGNGSNDTGIRTQYIADNSEVPSPGTANYDTYIAQSGTYAGHYFVSNSPSVMNGFGLGVNFVQIAAASTLGNGSHTLSVTLQATDSSQHNIGSPVSFSYNFSVYAQPTFNVTPPGSYPPIPGFTAYWQYLAQYGAADAQQFVTSEVNLPGQYLNDNFSSSMTVNGYGMWNYDGSRVAYGIADELKTISTAWQAGQNYSLWQVIFDGTNVEVASTGGHSGSNPPSWNNTVGGITSDGTVRWTNVGCSNWWIAIAERVHDQVRDWQLFHAHYTTDSEWNRFTDGNDMHCHRFNSVCNGSLPDTRAVEYFLFPFFSPSGGWANVNQRIIWNGVAPETDTWRDLEYEIEALYNYWVMTGSAPVDNNINELTRRVDLAVSGIAELVQYNPFNNSGLGLASFDIGLRAEALYHYWQVMQFMGQPEDGRIPIEVGKMLDWTYSHEFNLTGSDYNLPYTLWVIPYGRQMYNYEQSDLNMLLAPAYAWYGAINGGQNCTLPTSGAGCWNVADTMFQKAFANVYGASKEFAQLYKAMADYIGWRTGTMAGTDSSILPSHNQYTGTSAVSIEPYPQSEWAADVAVSNVTSTSATFSWYNTQQVSNTLVKCYANSNLTGTPVSATGGRNSQVAGSDNLYFNQLTINGLGPGGMYYCAVGGSNGNGTALSAYDILYEQGYMGECYNGSGCSSAACNSDPNLYAVCTSGTSGQLSISTTNLPSGELFANYSTTLSAINGNPPYSWSIASGSLPSGLVLSTGGTISGIPTAAGTSSFTVKVTDSSHNTATANLNITVVGPPLITTTSLPNGRTGTPYSAILTVAGGVAPFMWSVVSGSLPPGLMLTAFNGQIIGTPTTTGTYTPGFQVTDANNRTARVNLSITITGNGGGTLRIATTSLAGGTVGVLYGASLQATGGVQPYTWAQVGGLLPPGLVLTASGAIGGTPTTSGSYGFTVQVSDSSSPQQAAQATLSITIAPASLQITTTELNSGTVNTFYQSQLDATGGTTPYTWSLVSGKLPVGLTLNRSGLIAGIPVVASQSNFTIQVRDSGNPQQTATQPYTLTINPKPTLSIPSQQLPSGTVGMAYQAIAEAAGGTPPYTWSASSLLPSKLTLGLTGEIYGTPSMEGSYEVGLVVKDSANPPATATASLALIVDAEASLRITTNELPITTVGFPYQAELQSTGGEAPVKWSITAGKLPSGLVLSPDTGVIAGTPMSTTVQDLTVEAEDSQGTKAIKVVTLGVLNPLRPKAVAGR